MFAAISGKPQNLVRSILSCNARSHLDSRWRHPDSSANCPSHPPGGGGGASMFFKASSDVRQGPARPLHRHIPSHPRPHPQRSLPTATSSTSHVDDGRRHCRMRLPRLATRRHLALHIGLVKALPGSPSCPRRSPAHQLGLERNTDSLMPRTAEPPYGAAAHLARPRPHRRTPRHLRRLSLSRVHHQIRSPACSTPAHRDWLRRHLHPAQALHHHQHLHRSLPGALPRRSSAGQPSAASSSSGLPSPSSPSSSSGSSAHFHGHRPLAPTARITPPPASASPPPSPTSATPPAPLSSSPSSTPSS